MFGGRCLGCEQLRRPRVSDRAFLRSDGLGHGGAQDRVGEVELAARRQDRRGQQRVGDLRRLRKLEPGERAHVAKWRVRAEDAERLQERLRSRGEVGDLSREDTRDAVGSEGRDAGGRLVGRLAAVGRDRGDERAHEQRVAARRLVTRAAEAIARRLAERRPHQLRGRSGAERGRADRIARRQRHELTDELGLRGSVAAAQRDEHEHADARETCAKVSEIAQRGAVGPVAIVDRQQQRRPSGNVRGQPVQPVQRRMRHVLARYPGARCAGGERRARKLRGTR